MGLVDEPLPTTGESKYTAEADVRVLLAALKAEFNGEIDLENLSTALRSSLDLAPRDQSVVDTEQTRANSAYATLTTADQVGLSDIPANGIVCVHWEAEWKETNTGTARAALFVDGNQRGVEASIVTPATWFPMGSGQTGLFGGEFSVVSGIYVIPASVIGDDTTIDVRFKSTDASTVTVRNRVLSAWAEAF